MLKTVPEPTTSSHVVLAFSLNMVCVMSLTKNSPSMHRAATQATNKAISNSSLNALFEKDSSGLEMAESMEQECISRR